MFSSVHSIDPGVITAFGGAIGNIPTGWFLCDGTNGTPDLRDKFLVSDGPNFSVGDEGGNIGHSHFLLIDPHQHTPRPGFGLVDDPGFRTQSNFSEDSGQTNPALNLPKYYALAYIQYQGE